MTEPTPEPTPEPNKSEETEFCEPGKHSFKPVEMIPEGNSIVYKRVCKKCPHSEMSINKGFNDK